MKIAVVEFTGRSGMIHYAFQLCRALAEAEPAEVVLVTHRNYELEDVDAPFRVDRVLRLWDAKPLEEGPPSGLRRLGRVARRTARAVRYYREWARLHRHLVRARPDVVQFGDVRFPTDLVPLAALRRSGLRLVDICHNVDPYALGGTAAGLFRRGALTRAAYRRIYRQFDHVFVHHEVNREAFLRAYGSPPTSVTVIPHGNERLFEELRDPRIDPGVLRRRLELKDDAPVVLLFGTLSRYKGVDLLLEAFARLHADVPAARLVVAGYPMADFDAEAHRRLAAQLGIQGAVRFLFRYVRPEDVAAWMELAAVAVYPYRTVFQSGALQVALTFGVPVVATRVGAMPEVLGDGIEGLLVPPGDPAALADALRRLLEDRELAQRLGGNAARAARTRFAWDKIAKILLNRYRDLLRNGSRTAAPVEWGER